MSCQDANILGPEFPSEEKPWWKEVVFGQKGGDRNPSRLLTNWPEDVGVLNSESFVLVAVLLMLAALAAFVGAFAVYAANTAVSVRLGDARLRTDALVNSAVELTAYHLIGLDDTSRPSSGAFRFQLGHAKVAVEFRTEGARIDLNFAPKELLSGLFATLGAKQEDADFAADRVIGWRKKNQVPNRNPEADLYKDAGLKYAPRQTPFQNVAELRFLLGVSPALVARAFPFVTVFNGRAEIDVNEAKPRSCRGLAAHDAGSLPPQFSSNAIRRIHARLQTLVGSRAPASPLEDARRHASSYMSPSIPVRR